MVKTRSPSCEDFLPQPFPQADIFVTMKKHIGVHYGSEDRNPPKEDKPDSLFILNPTLRQAAIA